jgi:Flp pilus assembly protein TadD
VNFSELKKKLPLINSDSKKTRILGYVVYAWLIMAVLGAMIPNTNENIATKDEKKLSDSEVQNDTDAPNTAEEWLNEAEDLRSDEKYGEAVNAYKKAVELEPGNYKYAMFLGIGLDEAGRLDEALKAYDKAIALDPHNIEAWGQKRFSLDNAGRKAEAK